MKITHEQMIESLVQQIDDWDPLTLLNYAKHKKRQSLSQKTNDEVIFKFKRDILRTDPKETHDECPNQDQED